MKCIVCGQPVPAELREVGLCGPCCTGEADSMDYYGGDSSSVPDPNQCCGMVGRGRFRCPQVGDRARDGKRYCHQHDPLGKHQVALAKANAPQKGPATP